MDGGEDDAGLAGLRVLVVEDNPLIAAMVADILTERGCTIAGLVGSVERDLAEIARDLPDVVVLDVELANGAAGPVAAALRTRGIPFVVATGHVELGDPTLRDAPRVSKPFTGQELTDAVARVAAGRRRD